MRPGFQIDIDGDDLNIRQGHYDNPKFVIHPVATATIRLDPYEQDFYEIRYLPDTNEIVVLYNGEAIHSHILQEP